MGATNTLDRMAASIGLLDAVDPVFRPCHDVQNAGVLVALPALLINGVFSNVNQSLGMKKSYYGIDSILLFLAFLFLCRVKNLESFRYTAPGEWGKILGLDRVPEVKTLRRKIQEISSENDLDTWSHDLVEYWLGEKDQQDYVFYIDGHTRVYHGDQTKLPKHYVARQKLCMRATSDYWVNSMNGEPFFYTNKVVDPGLIETVKTNIIPEINKIVPLETFLAKEPNKYAHRFSLVFDREGYSPEFFLEMKKQKIAIITYKKYDKEIWPPEEFKSIPVNVHGNIKYMMLAERGVFLSNLLWVREIRKLTASGHQTTILSTNFIDDASIISGKMFDRWSQENFFKYMRQEFGLDKLACYSLEDVDETTKVINPKYREIEGNIKSTASKITRLKSKFGSISSSETLDNENIEKNAKAKAELLMTIKELQEGLDEFKKARKEIKKHVAFSDLPEDARFKQLETRSRKLLDTIKMIAYRAEHSLANTIKPNMTRPDEAKVLLKALFQTPGDIIPNNETKTLTIKIHNLANASNNSILEKLCVDLNECQIKFPRTELVLKYELVSSSNP